MSSDRAGASEPVSSVEVIRLLNINTLHSSLGPFGITEVSAEVTQSSRPCVSLSASAKDHGGRKPLF